jgi:hypothetical protein
MAREEIFLGTTSGDSTGNSLKAGGQKINNNFIELYNTMVGVIGKSIIPTDTPSGTGVTSWVAITPGTYTNFGGVVVDANSFAVISRDIGGAFTISQTTLDLSTYQKIVDGNKIKNWVAQPYLSGDQVNHLGKDWYAKEDTAAGDVPGTSSKWVERLSGYAKNVELVYQGSRSATRLLIPLNDRKKGMVLKYVENEITIIEEYTGTSFTDANWANTSLRTLGWVEEAYNIFEKGYSYDSVKTGIIFNLIKVSSGVKTFLISYVLPDGSTGNLYLNTKINNVSVNKIFLNEDYGTTKDYVFTSGNLSVTINITLPLRSVIDLYINANTIAILKYVKPEILQLFSANSEIQQKIINTSQFISIDKLFPLASGQYYDSSTSKLAVPLEYRKKGLIIQYININKDIITEEFYSDQTNFENAVWTNALYWQPATTLNSALFNNDILSKFPALSDIKYLRVKQLKINVSNFIQYLSIISVTQSSLPIKVVFNINHSIDDQNNKKSSIECTLSGSGTDLTNLFISGSNEDYQIDAIVKRTVIRGGYSDTNISNPWADIVNLSIDTSEALKTTPFSVTRVQDLYNVQNGVYSIGLKKIIKYGDCETLTPYPPINGGVSSYVKNYHDIIMRNNKKFQIDGEKIYNKIHDLKYRNCGINFIFLDVTRDDKYWFSDFTTKKIGYYISIEDIVNNTNYVELPYVFNVPIGVLRMNNEGELIVCTHYKHSKPPYEIPRSIWKSDSNFTNWTKKMDLDNNNVGFAYPEWEIDIKGKRIVIAAYGAKGTDAKYFDILQAACWSIYYSPDNGNTWYNRLFDAGHTVDINGWDIDNLVGSSPIEGVSYPNYIRGNTHIHGVAIDAYRNRLMVFNGDYNRSIWVTDNLEEWENNPIKENDSSPINTNSLHWLRLPIDSGLGGGVGMKYVNGLALPDCIIMGNDATPNGFERINFTSLDNNKNEMALASPEWAYQTALNGDYGFYGSTLYRRSPDMPILAMLRYVGGLNPTDVKRNMLFASNDGYTFSKIWENQNNLVALVGGVEQEIISYGEMARIDSKGNIFIFNRDGYFNPPTGEGYISDSYDQTLVIGKL